MPPQKRANAETAVFESSEAQHHASISKQKLAAQAQLAGSRGRRANGTANGKAGPKNWRVIL